MDRLTTAKEEAEEEEEEEEEEPLAIFNNRLCISSCHEVRTKCCRVGTAWKDPAACGEGAAACESM